MSRVKPLTDEELVDYQDIMAPSKQRLGFIPNSQRVMARKPELLEAFNALGKAVNNQTDGSIPASLKYMIANACMHCVDPVFMIGCPTGAIHRSQQDGEVVINDAACIGCATCANSCPYDNIRMVEAREAQGNVLVDNATQTPIMKATKCDLCFNLPGGPACERACPHDALKRVDMTDSESLRVWLDR